MLADLRETCLDEHYALNAAAPLLLWQAMHLTVRGDFDSAVEKARIAADEVFTMENLMNADVATSTLVEALIARGAAEDLDEAAAAIERLASMRPNQRWALRDLYVLRLRALLARAHGNHEAYERLRDEYRAMAADLGYEGHIAWAAAMA